MTLELNRPYRYKELCEIFGEEEKGGNSKVIQINKWRQYYDIEKNGVKFTVLKKYDENEVQLTENIGKYTMYITNLLVQYLAAKETNKITMTYREIFEALWMVNDKYYPAKYGQRDIENDITYKINPMDKNIDVDKMIATNMSMFFNISGRILKQIVNDALKSMEKKSLLIANKSFRLFRTVYTTSGEKYIESHDCTEREAAKILDIQKTAMQQIGISSTGQLFYVDGKKRQKYFEAVSDGIQREFGYDRYAKTWDLILGERALQIEKRNIEKSQRQLNDNVAKRLLTSQEMKIISATINEQMVKEYIKK